MKLSEVQAITEDLEYSAEFASMILESEGDMTEIDPNALDDLLTEMLVEAQNNGQAS